MGQTKAPRNYSTSTTTYNPSYQRNNNNNNNNGPRYVPTPRDPNTMEVDALTTQERDQRLKHGACFNCNVVGHLSRDCPTKRRYTGPYTGNRNNNNNYSHPQNQQESPKRTIKDLRQEVRTLDREGLSELYSEIAEIASKNDPINQDFN